MEKKTKNIALGGLMVAISVVLLYLATIMPSGRIVLAALASLPVALMIIESGLKLGILTYISTGLLYFLVTGNLKGFISYMVFFGIYPVVKQVAEKLPNVIREYALKFAFFNLSLYIGITSMKFLGIDFFTVVQNLSLPFGLSDTPDANMKFALPYMIFGLAQVVFLVYDYGFNILLGSYLKRFKK